MQQTRVLPMFQAGSAVYTLLKSQCRRSRQLRQAASGTAPVWIQAITAAIGIVADLYQAHDNVTGTLTVYGATVLKGTVTASTADNASYVKGTILYDGGVTGAIDLKKSGSSLKGTITAGTLEVADVSLAHTADRGLLSYEKIAPNMETGITAAIASSRGAKKRQLQRAKR